MSESDPPEISIVIPTAGVEARGGTVWRAIASVLRQRHVRAVPMVVLNGDRFDRGLRDLLAACPDIRFLHRAEPGVAAARHAGRLAVETPFFGFLDDDDEFLEESLSAGIAALGGSEAPDVAILNGRHTADGALGDQCVRDVAAARADPVGHLLRENWLTNCAGVFRTATCGPELFADLPNFLEWTVIAYRLALARRLAFLDLEGFLYHRQTANRASDSLAYVCESPAVLRSIAAMPGLPMHVRRRLDAKYRDALHHAASRLLGAGKSDEAWRYHVRSLGSLGSLKYLSFTRRLVLSRGRA